MTGSPWVTSMTRWSLAFAVLAGIGTAMAAPAARPATRPAEALTIGLIANDTVLKTIENWRPFADALGTSLHRPIKLVAAKDQADIVAGVKRGEIQIAWLTNRAAIELVESRRMSVFAQMVRLDGSLAYRSLLLVSKSGPIRDLDDLFTHPGAYRLAAGEPSSLAGYLVPNYHLFHKRKVDLLQHFRSVAYGNHFDGFLAIADNRADVATNSSEELARYWNEWPMRAHASPLLVSLFASVMLVACGGGENSGEEVATAPQAAPSPGAPAPAPSPSAPTPAPAPGESPAPAPGASPAPSPAPGAAPSPSPAPAPAPAPGASPSPSPTPSPAPAPGASPSPSPAPGASPTPSPSPSPSPSPAPAPAPVAFCNTAISAALASGDASALTDAVPLAKCGRDLAASIGAAQGKIVNSIYSTLGTAYAPGDNSQYVNPINVEKAQSFIVGDAGYSLAGISTANGGRSAAYGGDVLYMLKSNPNLPHAPAFKRLLSWLVSGSADTALPAKLTVGWAGYKSSSGAGAFTNLGVAATHVNCDFVANPSCAKSVQLLVVSDEIAASPTLKSALAAVLKGGTPVLYVHEGGSFPSDGGAQLLAALSFGYGDYYGNYWRHDAVPSSRTTADNQKRFGTLGGLVTLLDKMANNSWRTDYDWSKCDESCDKVPGFQAELLAPAALAALQINGYTTSSQQIFATADNTLHRVLALWGDITRQTIKYPVAVAKDAKAFQRALVADGLVAYVRPKVAAQADLGTFVAASVKNQAVSAADETVSVTLNDKSGFTAIGRFAVPGKTLQVELVKAVAGNVSLQLNTQRDGSTFIAGNDYDRPTQLRSPTMPLTAGAPVQVTSPYGGTLQLVFGDVTPGTVVQLKLRGVGKHAFIDYLNTGTDVTPFTNALNTNAFDWAEIRVPGFELHSTAARLKTGIKDGGYGTDLKRYVDEIKTYVVEDAYQLAGYSLAGKSLPAAVLSFCSARGWDCTSAIHKAPSLQHVNSDWSVSCGYGCSGNPIELAWGFEPRGWGESHELGHNLQNRWLDAESDRSDEVSNNVFPWHKLFRLYNEGKSTDLGTRDYKPAFAALLAARKETDRIAGAYNRIWADDSYADNNDERVAFYMQWVHYWGQRNSDIVRGWDIVTLLYLHMRQLDSLKDSDWAAAKTKLGYGNYAKRPEVNGTDNLLIALSTITQRDQRPTFDLWGLRYSATASAQVAAFKYTVEPAIFYATPNGVDFAKAVRIDMGPNATPVWPKF
ncbi:MAG: ImpA family metalloprotease [Burkholderiaceae bacterium]